MAELIIFWQKKYFIHLKNDVGYVDAMSLYGEETNYLRIYIFFNSHAKFLYKVPSTYLPNVP